MILCEDGKCKAKGKPICCIDCEEQHVCDDVCIACWGKIEEERKNENE